MLNHSPFDWPESGSELSKARSRVQMLEQLNLELATRSATLEELIGCRLSEHSAEMARLIENSEQTITYLEDQLQQLQEENAILRSSIITYQERISDLNREYMSMWAKK